MSSLIVSRLYTVNTHTMLAAIELTDLNWSRIDSYIHSQGLRSSLLWHDPYYRFCLVECEDWDYTMLVLLS